MPLTIEEIISGIMVPTPGPGGAIGGSTRAPLTQEALIRELAAAPPPEPEPRQAKVGVGRGIGLALADALSTYAAGLSPFVRPQHSLEQFRGRKQEQLDRETEAETRTQRQDYQARQRALGAVLGLREAESTRKFQEGQLGLQRAGQAQQLSIADMEDKTRRDLAAMTDKRERFLAEQSKVNPKLVAQENATWADVNAVLNAYRLGTDPKISAKYKDRIAAGEDMQDILTEIGWRLDEIPGVTAEQKELALTRIYVEMLQFENRRQQETAKTAPFTGRDPITGEVRQIGGTRSPYTFGGLAGQVAPDILGLLFGEGGITTPRTFGGKQ